MYVWLSIGKLVLGRVIGIAHRRPRGEQLDQANPVRNDETGLWQCPFCNRSDFPELSEVCHQKFWIKIIFESILQYFTFVLLSRGRLCCFLSIYSPRSPHYLILDIYMCSYNYRYLDRWTVCESTIVSCFWFIGVEPFWCGKLSRLSGGSKDYTRQRSEWIPTHQKHQRQTYQEPGGEGQGKVTRSRLHRDPLCCCECCNQMSEMLVLYGFVFILDWNDDTLSHHQNRHRSVPGWPHKQILWPNGCRQPLEVSIKY